MAKIINSKNNQEKEVPDGSSIREAAEELGVPFSCRNGICGTCMIEIHSGKENLSELKEQEHDLERDEKHRLACQCKIKQGEVSFKSEL